MRSIKVCVVTMMLTSVLSCDNVCKENKMLYDACEIRIIPQSKKIEGTRLLSSDTWKDLEHLVIKQDSVIDAKKWQGYVNFLIKYRSQPNKLVCFYKISYNPPLKLAMKLNGEFYELSLEDSKAIKKLVETSPPLITSP